MPLTPVVVALEVLQGLAPFAEREVAGRFGRNARRREDSTPTEVRYDWRLPLSDTLGLTTVVAAHLARPYGVPRPRGLLGDEHFRALLDQLAAAVTLHPDGTFPSFRFSAAGRSSVVFQRLAQRIAEVTGLGHDPDDGALLIRLRPAPEGWEVLVRLSPRPQSARSWRVADLPGALNATIAAAMVAASRPSPRVRAQRLVGVDSDAAALAMAVRNLAAIGIRPSPLPSLLRADATGTPFPAGSFDVVLCDLPYGHRMGGHDTNLRLYRAFLAEAARLLVRGGRLVVITHELRRFDAALGEDASQWTTRGEFQVFQKGHHPKVWVLSRR